MAKSNGAPTKEKKGTRASSSMLNSDLYGKMYLVNAAGNEKRGKRCYCQYVMAGKLPTERKFIFEIFGDECYHDAVNVRKAIAESNKKWEKPDIQKLIKETKDHRET